MHERSNRVVSTTYEIVTAGRECVCDEVVPIVSFSRVKRWYRLAQEKYEELYSSGLPEE